MKKSIFLLFISICSWSYAQQFDYHPADWSFFNDADFRFTKPIDKIKSTTFSLSPEDIRTEVWQIDEMVFENGYLIKWEQKNIPFKQHYLERFNYKDFNTVTQMTSREILKDNEIIEVSKFIYDKDHEDMITEILVTEYKSTPQKVDTIEFKIDIVLDDRGVRRQDIYYDRLGKVEHKLILGYNEIGLKNSRKRLNQVDQWVMTDSVVYAEGSRRKLKDIIGYPDIYDNNKPKYMITQYHYNKEGLITQVDIEGKTYKFKYKLDDQGHWIERRSYIEQMDEVRPFQLVIREIDYTQLK